jgi:monolysocardiolipin acyltransferase
MELINRARIIMDAEEMPEVIPIWISRFDTLMPESRSWPRLIPRKGGNVSITIGKPLTSTIKPLVDEWKKIAQNQRDDLNGKELPIDGNTQSVREVADREDGRERQIRVRICEVLQKAVHSLGVEVERKEGRFETGEWSHSTKRLDTPAAKDKVSDGTGETPI